MEIYYLVGSVRVNYLLLFAVAIANTKGAIRKIRSFFLTMEIYYLVGSVRVNYLLLFAVAIANTKGAIRKIRSFF
ncbi:hypothetical protein [Myroides sp. WP-1]|uniref:hypothetical protein n=1 Tax=Myroides sp. WP-1 TaxID=2759944 RepID=UPI0015F8F02D|nr:hypothetical protein [Myroides sp. WP-1]MBB1140799.1 hypothetical protein [Myroides sp. WP-1]